MAYDNDQRMNANQQKEGQDQKPAANTEDKNWKQAADAEFAADTWMGAVLNPDASNTTSNTTSNNRNANNTGKNDRDRATITYDPYTQTERYRGDESLDGGTVIPPMAGASELQIFTGEPETTDTTKPTVKRTIIDDGVADVNRETRYEVASEIAPDYTRVSPRSQGSQQAQRENAGSGMGMTAVGLAILSLFLLPYLLAPVAMVIGYLAMRRGARSLGIWALVIGAVAILGAMVIYPYFTAR